MKIRAMGDELFHAGGRTHMTKLFAILLTRLKTTKEKKQPQSLNFSTIINDAKQNTFLLK
jgi:hypothetical protein